MLRFFKKNLKNTQEIVLEPTTKYLANQLDFLNGNYTTLLLDPAKGNTRRKEINTQLDFYLRRFFAKDSTRLLALGGGVGCKYNKNISGALSPNTKARPFWVTGIYGDGFTATRDATCLLCFVDSFEALKDIYEQTLSQVEHTHEFRGHTHPMPPIIIITQEEDSPLRDTAKIRQLPDIPILDSWYLDQPTYVRYHNHNGTHSTEISDETWVRIMEHIAPLYSQLAIARGLIHKEVIDTQAEFLLCTDKLNEQGQSCPDIQSLIAGNLFRFNVDEARKKSNDFTTEPTVTYHKTKGCICM